MSKSDVINYKKLTKKLTYVFHFGQITVNSNIFCQLFVTLDNFLSIFVVYHVLNRIWFYQFDHCNLVVILCHRPLPLPTWPPSLASLTAKVVGPCQCMYYVFEDCILGTSTSLVPLPFFPWCNPKSSCDEFNSQSTLLQRHGPTSWSIV